ncbi:unnamed protein product [Moneuplotes crassus]|uniref:Uncharacterized protein n=1 Tax=Euplotes crassus TaxID=5936 RepID=A0AAD1XJR0_EUPCR|nr:unnamed protein product [Moneuplotes crassus]
MCSLFLRFCKVLEHGNTANTDWCHLILSLYLFVAEFFKKRFSSFINIFRKREEF